MAAFTAEKTALLEYVALATPSTGAPLDTSPPFQPMKPEVKLSSATLEPMPVV